MAIRLYNAYTPGTRNRSLSDFSTITTSTPEKSLLVSKKSLVVEIIKERLQFDIVVADISKNIELLILNEIKRIFWERL